jgi:hydrogenase maturation protein HypF
MLTWRGKFQRVGHLRYLPLIGGEASILEPMRTAASYLIYLLGEPAFSVLPEMGDYRNLLAQLNVATNVVFTSSTGRLFDAVSALLGICRQASYDGQAPAMLEAAADARERGSYFDPADLVNASSGLVTVDPKRWLTETLKGIHEGVSPAKLSRRFHNTFIAALASAAKALARQHKVKSVCLSGGSFQNRLLLQGLTQTLTDARLAVFTNHAVPVNDGGLSLGQAVVAAAQRKH